jgi:hypothetical protein
MPLKAALPENKQRPYLGHTARSVQEPWWSRTGIEPTDFLIKSGAPPLSYGPVTKDAGTMPHCSSVSNQENGLATVRGFSGADPIGSSLAH